MCAGEKGGMDRTGPENALTTLTAMSSFKRKSSAKKIETLAGTRSLPGSPQSLLVSTGVPSLDDVLGGGLPLSTILLVSAPDPHSHYGELVLKYGISQGLVSGHNICIVGDDSSHLASQCMWQSSATVPKTVRNDDLVDGKIKIAWRYEQMKQFRTTVPSTIS